ncbi:MAG: sensor histidine kinase [Gemmatimonadaceae bacterium]
MKEYFARIRPRVSFLALGVTLLFALAGLFAADRMLTAGARNEAMTRAIESAALIEGFLRVHVQALRAIRGLHMDTTRTLRGEDFHTLMDAMAEHASSFRRVWVTDSAGVIQYERAFGKSGAPLFTGLDMDTLSILDMRYVMRKGRSTSRTQVSPPDITLSRDYGFAIVEPIIVGRRFRGSAGGTITSDAVLGTLHARGAHAKLHHVVMSGADTVAIDAGIPAVGRVRFSRAEEVRTPGGEPWQVMVAYDPANHRIRVALWVIGLSVLGALFVALVHERRQGIRLGQRSAELERLSVELLRANRAKSEFLASVSHELRTPLNAIVGFADLLRDGVYGDLTARQGNPVDRIASSAAHLWQLVDQVLDIARMAAGRLDVHRESIDIRTLLLTVATEVEPLISQQSLSVSIAVGTSLPRVSSDPTHLRQIIVNLLGNAIKCTPSGSITLRARVVKGSHAPRELGDRADGQGQAATTISRRWMAVQVIDTGVGIAEKDLARIFEEFEQVDAGPRTDSMRRGTGLGLAISRRLARALGGEITVESEPGKGSTFSIWLPLEGNEPIAPAGSGSGAAVTQ